MMLRLCTWLLEPREIVALVVRQGGALAVGGIVLGVLGSFALTRFLTTFLFGVDPRDPATMVLIVTILAEVTLVACVVPATRAVRIDPSEALRCDS